MSSKYAALPDLDSSQDIYETPDLVDTSTLPTSDTVSEGNGGEEEEEDYSNPINCDHLRPSDARGRFKRSDIDARGVDFSDRISGKRKSYRASSRRRRRRVGGGYEDEDEDEFEDEDDEGMYGDEALERRLARLRKEVEGLRGEFVNRDEERRKEEDMKEGGGVGDEDEDEREEEKEPRLGIDDLSNVLEGLQTVSGEERGAQAKLAKKLATSLAVAATPKATGQAVNEKDSSEAPTTAAAPEGPTATYTITYSPAFKKSHALAKAADFDNRLTVLEKVLGMSSSSAVNIDKQLPTSAMIPTLDELTRQLSVLTTSSTSSLDAASRRVKQLTQEAEKLVEARKAAKAAADARREDIDQALVQGTIPADSSERDAKINALYGSLPTIESLGPLLPAVLDRLRSLRTIHADAGRAVESLKKVERRQEEMSGEIARWREALEKVENIVRESEGTVKGNISKVEGWVKELEEKAEDVLSISQG